MSSGPPCGAPNWGQRYSREIRQCAAGSAGQGCDDRAGSCGTCYRARARSFNSPILEWFSGPYVYCITSPDVLADDGLQAGDFILQIDDQEVSKSLIAAASQSVITIKLLYYRPGQSDQGTVEVPNLGNVAGFMGLALSQPGPLASYGVGQWDCVVEINGQSVEPDLFVQLADTQQHATSLTYKDFTFTPHTLSLT